MGFIKTILNNVLGLNSDSHKVATKNGGEIGKRKRDLEEEDLCDFDASASVSSKNSLNSQPPLKRLRMEQEARDKAHSAKSPFKKLKDQLSSWFFRSPKADEVFHVEEVAVEEETTQTQATVPGLSVQGFRSQNLGSESIFPIETVDLVDDEDEDKENLPLPTATLDLGAAPASSSSTLSTLASFGGFTARNFTEPSPSSSVMPAPAPKPGLGHIIMTQQEKVRRAKAMSPESVRNQFKTGHQSRFDNYHSEKDIAKRVFQGGTIKQSRNASKSGSKIAKTITNTFKYADNLRDKERYRQMLERFGVIKYPALTNRKTIVKKSSTSDSAKKQGPVVPRLNLKDEVDTSIAKPVTSTVIKPSVEDVLSSNNLTLDIAASPVLGRDKLPSAGKVSFHQDDSIIDIVDDDEDDEVVAVINEVTSPKYLERLHNKYGAIAREREKQIQRETSRKEKCEKETEDVFNLIDKRLETHLKITQAAVDESGAKDSEFDESQPTEVPSMTPDMQAVIKRAKSSRGEVLIDAHKIQITVKDIDTLSGLNWLNDEIINFYMQMIVSRAEKNKENYRSVYAFSTFFYPRLMDAGYNAVKRWTKKVDLFSYSLVLIPVHLGMHWCLATVDMDAKSINYYDSMGGNNKAALRGLSSYLQEEHKTKKGSELDLSGWKQIIAKKIPQQMNGSDCGMFTCKFAEYSSRRARFTFGQDLMPYFRKRMVYEIVSNKLLHP